MRSNNGSSRCSATRPRRSRSAHGTRAPVVEHLRKIRRPDLAVTVEVGGASRVRAPTVEQARQIRRTDIVVAVQIPRTRARADVIEEWTNHRQRRAVRLRRSPAAIRHDDQIVGPVPIVRAVEKARAAVVSIHTTQLVWKRNWYSFEPPRPVEGKGIGSGVIFHPAGYVITNAHVISRATSILVDVHLEVGQAKTREARIVAVDLPHDLAILRLVPAEGEPGEVRYPYLPLGRSDDLMVGETVIAMSV